MNREIVWRERYSTVCEICEHVMKRPEVLAVLHKHLTELAAHVWAVRSSLETEHENVTRQQVAFA